MKDNRKPVHFDYEVRLVFFAEYFRSDMQRCADERVLMSVYVHSEQEKEYWIKTMNNLYHRKKRNYFGVDYTIWLTCKEYKTDFHYGIQK